jgi:hypothetical protein
MSKKSYSSKTVDVIERDVRVSAGRNTDQTATPLTKRNLRNVRNLRLISNTN